MSRLAWLALTSFAACGLVACSTYSAIDVGAGAAQVSVSGTGSTSALGGAASKGNGGNEAKSGSASDAGRAGSDVVSGGSTNDGGAPSDGGTSTGGTGGNASAGNAGSGGAAPSVKPTGLTLGTETVDVVREPGSGGTAFSERCPDNQVVIGFNGTAEAPGGKLYVRSVQAICGVLSLSASKPWQVLVTDADTLPLHDIDFPQKQSAKCPANQVMTGFGGRSGLWMDSVDVRCAKLTILGDSPSFLLVVATPATAGTIGGASGGPFDPLECDAGSVAVGQVGDTIYSGDVLGKFGVHCATVTLEVGSE